MRSRPERALSSRARLGAAASHAGPAVTTRLGAAASHAGPAAAAGLGLAVALHAGPAATWLPGVRRRLAPGLHGLGTPGHLALTFDDGPDPASTPAFLAALDRLGWRATFFLLGTMTLRSPGLAAEIAGAGHEVGLHGHEHHNQLFRSPRAVADDLARGREALASATGTPPRWHRPPYGVLSGAGVLASHRLGLRLVLWSAWGRDWRAQATPETVMADLAAGLDRSRIGRRGSRGGGHSHRAGGQGPGPTILLHDSDCTSAPGAWRSALGALPLLAERAEATGWLVGTLGEHGVGEHGVGEPAPG